MVNRNVNAKMFSFFNLRGASVTANRAEMQFVQSQVDIRDEEARWIEFQGDNFSSVR